MVGTFLPLIRFFPAKDKLLDNEALLLARAILFKDSHIFAVARSVLAGVVFFAVLHPALAPAQQQQQTDANGSPKSEKIASGKRRFMLDGDVASSSVTLINVLCDGFSSAKCGKRLVSYKGRRGTLLSSSPSYKDGLYLWYSVVLENDEYLALRVPRWRKLDNPLDASEFIIDLQDIERAQAMVNKPLLPSLDVAVSAYEISAGTVILVLDNGARLSLEVALQRMALLNNLVSASDHGRAFAALDELELHRSDTGRWRAFPRSASRMLLYGDLTFGRVKQMEMVVNHQGSGAVHFDAVEVGSPRPHDQPIYTRNFEQREVERVTDIRGGAIEQARVAVAAAERNLLATLIETPAQIILHGRYPVRGTLGQDQVNELRALMDLYELIDLPLSFELAATEAASARGS